MINNPLEHTVPTGDAAKELYALISNRQAAIGIVGMGYVGLPLAVATHAAGFKVIGFDNDAAKVERMNTGKSDIGRIGDDTIQKMRAGGRFLATADYAKLAECDFVIICVPTPLNKYREPDLSYIVATTNGIASNLRRGQVISLESTTYPGTTREVMKPILEATGLASGKDFWLAYSPEREDPGNPIYETATIPKVVGGDGEDAVILACRYYAAVVKAVVPVSSCETAEAVKLTENIFRSVNIALVNELKHIYTKMGINIWEVIDAASTKPFGYMPFYPGPGLGGHCIPIDPFYLTWKAREFDVPTRFIELAGEINTLAPVRVVHTLVDALSKQQRKSVAGSRILMLGLAYKKNVEDVRESPGFRLMDLLVERGGEVDYYDPYVPVVPFTREHANLTGIKSIEWDLDKIAAYDVVLICTNHDGVDYAALARSAKLVVDSRNALADVKDRDNIVMA